ncbi:hypothetical protein ACF0H5_014238 [Mactra antiquata]
MTVLRKCRRKCGIKKILFLIILCTSVWYMGTVFNKSRGVREVWNVKGSFNATDGHCGTQCGKDQLSFYVKTGVETKQGPNMCYQNKVIISDKKKNYDRGMNVIVINDKTLEIEFTKIYDTYIDDYDFLRDMKSKVNEGNLVIIASYDEVSENLSEDGKRWLKLFGSEVIDQVLFRDSFLFIGQKGLRQGYAIEFTQSRGEKLFADSIEKMGCFTLPLGPISPVEEMLPKLIAQSNIRLGDNLENCGVTSSCEVKQFPVMVSCGMDSKVLPEICVGGRMVMDRKTNDAGRGINVVIVDHKTSLPKAATRFDTYEKDSSNLDFLLEGLVEDDIIIAAVFDDASRKLGFHTRELLNQLGSSMAQNIKFRDVWYFIGQKGIDGFTNMEMISYAGMDAEWPKPLKASFCVPKKIIGSQTLPDPPVHRNLVRREFCKKYDGYGEFCDTSHVDDMFLQPADLVDEERKDNPVYSSPIVIVPGLNHNALIRTMETTMMQQGINPDNVLIAWDEKFPEQAELATMFQFRNISLSGSLHYSDQMIKAIEETAKMFLDSEYMIVIEEELILSPDFLFFLAQCTDVLSKDDTLLGVSAFNFNGFEETSYNKYLMYKVEDFPGVGFMIKMNVYTQRMKGAMKMCCDERSWTGWSLPEYNETHAGYMLVPDVSRVYRHSYQGAYDEDYLTGLFNRPRETSLDQHVQLQGLHTLTDKYDSEIRRYIKSSVSINHIDVTKCLSNGNTISLIDEQQKNYVLFYKQSNREGFYLLRKIMKCFKFNIPRDRSPKNMYKGILRFTYMKHNVMLIGSKSKFIQSKPETIQIFKDV